MKERKRRMIKIKGFVSHTHTHVTRDQGSKLTMRTIDFRQINCIWGTIEQRETIRTEKMTHKSLHLHRI